MGLIHFFIYLTRKYLIYLYFIQCYSLACYYLRITKNPVRFASKFLSKTMVFNISSQYYFKFFSKEQDKDIVASKIFTKLKNIVELTQKLKILHEKSFKM